MRSRRSITGTTHKITVIKGEMAPFDRVIYCDNKKLAMHFEEVSLYWKDVTCLKCESIRKHKDIMDKRRSRKKMKRIKKLKELEERRNDRNKRKADRRNDKGRTDTEQPKTSEETE